MDTIEKLENFLGADQIVVRNWDEHSGAMIVIAEINGDVEEAIKEIKRLRGLL